MDYVNQNLDSQQKSDLVRDIHDHDELNLKNKIIQLIHKVVNSWKYLEYVCFQARSRNREAK